MHVVSIVLTYNNFRDTSECVASLIDQDYTDHSIFVVDNGSSDDSLAGLKQRWASKVDFLETGVNLGVAAGYNAGLQEALSSGADYALLCNNDIVAEPDLVSSLLRVFEREPRTAIAVPVMTYYDRPDLIWFGWVDQQKRLMVSINRMRNRPMSALGARAGSVFASDYVPTCASMVSRAALDSVGLLDERFFFGHDDVDWSLRARAAGFQCSVLGRALVRHKVSVTSGIRGSNLLAPRAAYMHATGSVLIGHKHFRGVSAFAFYAGLLGLRLPYNVATLALARRWASVRAYLRGLKDGIRQYGPGSQEEIYVPDQPLDAKRSQV